MTESDTITTLARAIAATRELTMTFRFKNAPHSMARQAGWPAYDGEEVCK